jgi:hypothetical protein
MILYNRTSGYGKQAGHDRSNLEEKETVLYRAVRQLTEDRPLRKIVSVAGERGKVSAPRPGLIGAAQDARKLNAMLVAYDLSRFLRPEAYDPRKDPHAWPTPAEFEQLREMTFGVLLATVLPPWLSESERHSYLTKRTGKAGRKPKLSPERAAEVFAALGAMGRKEVSRQGEGYILQDRWQNSLREVAKFFGVSQSTLLAFIRDHENDLSSDGKRTYQQAALDLASEMGLLGENDLPFDPLTPRDRYRLWKESWDGRYIRRPRRGPHYGQLDMRYRENRQEGVNKDGSLDRRYNRDRSE